MSKRVLASSGLVIAAIATACGGGAPTTSGGPAVSLPPLPSIGIPGEVPSISIPTITLPSFAPDADLEALFPDSVNGQTLEITSAKGEDVVRAFGNTDPTRLQALISDLGVGMDHVSAAISFNVWPGATEGEFTGLTLIAVRVQGVPGGNTLAGLTEMTREDIENAQVGTASIGGKQVTAISNPEDADENVYLYAVGDVVFFGGGTPNHVEEAFAQLP